MPAIIPMYIQLAHSLDEHYYIKRVETRQHHTDSGRSWKKPYKTIVDIISTKQYFNEVFAAHTNKLIRVSTNYTSAGYLMETSTWATQIERFEVNYIFAYDTDYAKREGKYKGEIGTHIEYDENKNIIKADIKEKEND